MAGGGHSAPKLPSDPPPLPATPRPGIVEFGVGMAGIAMLMPRLARVYIP